MQSLSNGGTAAVSNTTVDDINPALPMIYHSSHSSGSLSIYIYIYIYIINTILVAPFYNCGAIYLQIPLRVRQAPLSLERLGLQPGSGVLGLRGRRSE